MGYLITKKERVSLPGSALIFFNEVYDHLVTVKKFVSVTI